MEYNILGRTGLKVSRISLGTVELGIDYGIKNQGSSNLPNRRNAIHILKYAADKGINLFDTAPAYGMSEQLLGEAIGSRNDCYIATKVAVPVSGNRILTGLPLKRKICKSIDNSLRALRRDTLDIVQIHNATVQVIERGEIMKVLDRERNAGKIRFLGASVYGVESALCAVKQSFFEMIQVAYNMLDQRMAEYVFPEANKVGVAIINRSVLFKGVLTSRARWLPKKLAVLQKASQKIIDTLNISWEELPQFACRFCLSSNYIHSILIGVASKKEIESAIYASLEGPLRKRELIKAETLGLNDENFLTRSYFMIP